MLDTCFRPLCCLKKCHNWENSTEGVHTDANNEDDIKTMIRTTIDGKKDNWKRLATVVNRVFLLIHLIVLLTLGTIIWKKLQDKYQNGYWIPHWPCVTARVCY